MSERRARKARIPLTVLTGPLGAGKTTLLNRLLQHPDFAETAVIINETGVVPIAGGVVEQADDGIIALGGGCVCCTVRGELIDALERLLRDLDNGRIAGLKRVVIETASIADPGAILGAVMRHPYLALRFKPDGIVTVVNAATVLALLESSEAFVKQAAIADLIAVVGHAPAGGDLAALNPIALILDASSVEVSDVTGVGPERTRDGGVPVVLPERSSVGPGSKGREARRIHAFAVTRDRAMRAAALDRFLDYLAALQGPSLVRVQGLIAVEGELGKALRVDGVGGFFYAPVLLEEWPDGDHRTRLAVVTRDLDQTIFEKYLDAFLNEVRIDAPDREALVNNPLSIAGFSARSGR